MASRACRYDDAVSMARAGVLSGCVALCRGNYLEVHDCLSRHPVSNGCGGPEQVGSLETYSECMPAGSAVDCQVGLTLSHMAVWKALAHSGQPAAWVFEYALHLWALADNGGLDNPKECCQFEAAP